jgi:DinB family protein
MSMHDSKLSAWESAPAEFVAFYRLIPRDSRTESIDGGWSARQVLQHLVEDEILFSTRVRAAIADPGSTILPFDAERYQSNLSYELVPDEVLIDALVALRAVNVGLLRALPDDAWSRTVEHPDAGEQSVELIATVFGGHIADHLNDLENAGLSIPTR